MRACGRCGHENADHLTYCFSCGRRLGGRPATPASAVGPGMPASALARGTEGGGGAVRTTAYAATVALSPPHGQVPTPSGSAVTAGPARRAFEALRYVFVYVRGRIDAEERKRNLGEERDGTRRLLEGALADLGQTMVAESAVTPPPTPELRAALEAVARAEMRRRAAVGDIAVAEKFLTSEDLRLGAEQASAESEWKACDAGAQGVDKTLHQVDDERRAVETELAKLRAAAGSPGERADIEARNIEKNAGRAALEEKRARLDEQYGALRERAAALRASTVGARAKLDNVIAARRHAAAAMAASLVGHTRERADAERQVRELTIQVGRLVVGLRLAAPALQASTARIDRLEETIADRDRQIAVVERAIGHYDARRLATGIGVLTAILGVVGASLWAVLH